MKFDMSEAWREAMAMLSGNREVLLVVAGLFFFLPNVALGFALGGMQEIMAMVDPKQAEDAMMTLMADKWWLIVLGALAAIIGNLALLALLRDQQRPTVGEALKTALRGLLPAFAANLLLGISIGVVFGALLVIARATGNQALAALVLVICAIGVIYVAIKFSLTAPVIAIDQVMNPIRALVNSWRLTKGSSLRLFSFYLLLGIAFLVLYIVVGFVLTLVTVALGKDSALVINAVLNGLLSAVASTVFVAVLAAIHRQLSHARG
jgi:hypothetical protein